MSILSDLQYSSYRHNRLISPDVQPAQWGIVFGARVEEFEKRFQAEQHDEKQPPYPWCIGNPTIEDCIRDGYCRRDPNCGE